MLLQNIYIETWQNDHPNWPVLMQCVQEEDQLDWVNFSAEFHQSSHILVALLGEEMIGFLRLVTQEIGPDMDCPPLHYEGKPLIEAKALAFGVNAAYRGQGVGGALQEAAIALAKRLGCYQLRSHSTGGHQANHHLKLSMGFGVHPVIRGEDKAGVYFIMPLGPNRAVESRTTRLSQSETVTPRKQASARLRERLQQDQEEA
jgi:GNAT superfamily N-acetyltransferase